MDYKVRFGFVCVCGHLISGMLPSTLTVHFRDDLHYRRIE